ncbi:MAG: translocation/assembly module TamB domain-containing protein, partial [Betaproteobacteria bacterium]
AFDVSLVQRVVDIRMLRANAGNGELVARGRVALDGARPYSVEGSARRFDPHRFGDFPKAALNATFKFDGVLAPAWRASGELTLAPGSEVSGIAVSGTARGEIDAARGQMDDARGQMDAVHWRNVQAQARIAGGSVSASGSAGRPGDKLVFALDIPELGTLRPLAALFPRLVAPDALPDPLRGALRASGSAFIQPGGSGIELEAHASNLAVGRVLSANVVDARASLPPVAAGTPIDARTVSLRASATGLSIAQLGAGVASTASLNVAGTLARHSIEAALSARAPDAAGAAADASRSAASVDARIALTGGFQGSGAASLEHLPWPWSGNVEVAENKGAYALALASPARLEIDKRRVRLSEAHLRIAEGSADIGEFVWDDGRITSRGSFAAVPLATLARLAGRALPVRATLTLKGDWSVAATPRLDGTVHVARDDGDVYATDADTVDPARAIGIAALDLSARFAGDGVDARASMRSMRGGNAEATLALAAAPGAAPGRISGDAPLTAKVSADVVSLRPFQSWLGTLAALDGRAHVEVAATGTLAHPQLSGTISADDVRVDLGQHGVQLKEGRLRARLAGERLLLDEVSIRAGDGVFNAKGTLAASTGSGVTPDVTWHAEHFRVVNRPDLRLVVAGDGTLRVISGKLLLAGNVRIEEGNIVYEATTEGRLADDVVVVGQAPRPPSTSLASVGDLPLALDLDVDLQPPGVAFAGEGLDTRLTGRVHLVTSASGTLNAKGTISTRFGTYFALGQKLTIDRGALIFDGPVDNPALDVVALRKNLAVEAGLELTGTVRVPRVRLVSDPPVPDNEKLSWLISGQPLDRTSRADITLLASASASLLGKGQKPLTQTIANTFGLDDISVRGSSVTTATGVASGQVVAFGKRLSDRLSLVYEQGLTIASNALRIEYTLTRTLTLRAEAGTVGSVGIYYRRSFD